MSGIPLIPSKLVKKIEEGNFVDMHELLPERLGAVDESNQGKAAKNMGKMVTSWSGCASLVCMWLSSPRRPLRVPNLLGYQTLILGIQKEYPRDQDRG